MHRDCFGGRKEYFVGMELKRFSLPIRIVVALGVGFFMFRFIFFGATGELSPVDKLIGLMLAGVYGFVLFELFGFPFMRRVATQFASFYLPSDEHFRVMPEY